MAGLATGVWTSKEEITSSWREQRHFDQAADRTAVEAHLKRCDQAVNKA